MSSPTEQQTYHRLRWDPRFDVARCSVVISLRPSGTQRMPFVELDTNVVPWHRIVEFWIDDQLAWSRPQRDTPSRSSGPTRSSAVTTTVTRAASSPSSRRRSVRPLVGRFDGAWAHRITVPDAARARQVIDAWLDRTFFGVPRPCIEG